MQAHKNGTKVVLLGQSGTGKTSIIMQYVRGLFTQGTNPTIGASFVTKTENVDGKETEISIWDTAGQELYRGLTPMYYRNAMAAIVVFDVCNEDSFNAVRGWVDEIRENTGDTIIAICGNKIDLETRAITKEQGAELAQSLDAMYFETSAATAVGINDLFHNITKALLALDASVVKGKIQEPITSSDNDEKEIPSSCC
jgi:small GTP-binding protein